jgi:hypothetical protein
MLIQAVIDKSIATISIIDNHHSSDVESITIASKQLVECMHLFFRSILPKNTPVMDVSIRIGAKKLIFLEATDGLCIITYLYRLACTNFKSSNIDALHIEETKKLLLDWCDTQSVNINDNNKEQPLRVSGFEQ